MIEIEIIGVFMRRVKDVRYNALVLLAILFLYSSLSASATAGTPSPHASLDPARPVQCDSSNKNCSDFDALVFVHGIYGATETFINSETKFDWPKQFPRSVTPSPLELARPLDVYRLNYRTLLLNWAKEKDTKFEDLAEAIFETMQPLRKRQYRSIGFIAHSLGGNVVSTYLLTVKLKIGHANKSQHAYVITLATPVVGAHVANLARELKQFLRMDDDLLKSLEADNLYLRMLNAFRRSEIEKGAGRGCRAIHLHAAFEQKQMAFFVPLIVNTKSAALPISGMVHSPIVGFPLNHSAIVKPANLDDPIHQWVFARVKDEFARLDTWGDILTSPPAQNPYCKLDSFKSEP